MSTPDLPQHYKLYGLDFTSTPSPRKPITCAVCTLEGTTLHLHECRALASLDDFDALLRTTDPWLAAFDFPLGLPRALIEHLGWPSSWESYMSIIASLDKPAFESILYGYMNSHPAGQKLLLRATDRVTGARSPMMLHRVPVGKMFFAGATRLYRSGICVLPCRPTGDNRIAVEGYPSLVARHLIGKRAYKSDERGKQITGQEQVRREMIQALRIGQLLSTDGLTVQMADDTAEMLVRDAMGDRLDAVLCAVQAGWAFLGRESGYGIPAGCDKDEGWIVDPY
jgi:hypothetical protein